MYNAAGVCVCVCVRACVRACVHGAVLVHCIACCIFSSCRELSGSVTSEQLSLLIAKNVQKSIKLFVMKCEQMVRAHTSTQCWMNHGVAVIVQVRSSTSPTYFTSLPSHIPSFPLSLSIPSSQPVLPPFPSTSPSSLPLNLSSLPSPQPLLPPFPSTSPPSLPHNLSSLLHLVLLHV